MSRKELPQPNWYGGDGNLSQTEGFDSNLPAIKTNGGVHLPLSKSNVHCGESDGLISPEEMGSKLAFSLSNPVSLSSNGRRG